MSPVASCACSVWSPYPLPSAFVDLRLTHSSHPTTKWEFLQVGSFEIALNECVKLGYDSTTKTSVRVLGFSKKNGFTLVLRLPTCQHWEDGHVTKFKKKLNRKQFIKLHLWNLTTKLTWLKNPLDRAFYSSFALLACSQGTTGRIPVAGWLRSAHSSFMLNHNPPPMCKRNSSSCVSTLSQQGRPPGRKKGKLFCLSSLNKACPTWF